MRAGTGVGERGNGRCRCRVGERGGDRVRQGGEKGGGEAPVVVG